MADGKLNEVADALGKISASSTAAVGAINEINDAVLKTGDSIGGYTRFAKGMLDANEKLSKGIGDLIGVVPGIGAIGGVFNAIGSSIGAAETALGAYAEGTLNVIKFGDSLTSVNRNLTAENFRLAAQFGQTLTAAEEMTSFMSKSSVELSQADFGYQNFNTETKEMIRTMAQNKLSFSTMREEVDSSYKSMNLYSMAVLQANSLGLEQSEYARLMSDNILRQGMTVQQSAETLALYGDIAGRTGLTVSSVAGALGGLGDSFRKMGLDANFGQSFLEGFVESLKETSIGIENATDLSQTFGRAVAGIATNYSTAYVTAQRGGLAGAGGGALSAGIQMQNMMLDPNINQAEFGKTVGVAISDTLKSFTGGDIVTVKEAATGDPALERAYYTQIELLKSMYGISDPNEGARTLELLQNIQNATVSGDQELMQSLGAQLEEAVGARQDTLSEEAKLQAQSLGMQTNSFNELGIHSRYLSSMLAVLARENLGIDAALKAGEESLANIRKILPQEGDGSFSEMLSTLSPEAKEEALRTYLENMQNQASEDVKNTTESVTMAVTDMKDQFIEALQSVFRDNKINVSDSEAKTLLQTIANKLGIPSEPVSNGGSKLTGTPAAK